MLHPLGTASSVGLKFVKTLSYPRHPPRTISSVVSMLISIDNMCSNDDNSTIIMMVIMKRVMVGQLVVVVITVIIRELSQGG